MTTFRFSMEMISLKPGQINIGGDLLDLEVPRVMGIVNVTPDSFYVASRARNSENIVDRVANGGRRG